MDQQRKSNWMDEANFSGENAGDTQTRHRDGIAGTTQETSDQSAEQESDGRSNDKGDPGQVQQEQDDTMRLNRKGPGKPGTE
jgi:hypothetical protein